MENENINKDLNEFLGNETDQEKKETTPSKPGISEKVIINKTLITEDGRELLREITHNRY